MSAIGVFVPFLGNSYSAGGGFENLPGLTADISKYSDDGVLDKWLDDVTSTSIKNGFAYLGDRQINKLSNDKVSVAHQGIGLKQSHITIDQLPKTFSEQIKKARSYNELLGIQKERIDFGPEGHLGGYKDLVTKEGLRLYKNTVKGNFESFLSPEYRQNLALKPYLKDTVLGGNLKYALGPLEKGEYFKSSLRTLGFGFMGWNVLSKTRLSYKNSQEQGDNFLKTWKDTMDTFLGQMFKTIVSWELGGIAAQLGSAIFCFGTIPPVLAGLVFGCLGGAIGYTLLSKVIRDPLPKVTQDQPDS